MICDLSFILNSCYCRASLYEELVAVCTEGGNKRNTQNVVEETYQNNYLGHENELGTNFGFYGNGFL